MNSARGSGRSGCVRTGHLRDIIGCMKKCASVGGALLLISVSMGCGDLWSPFLAYREGSDGIAPTEARPGLVLIPKGSFTMGSPQTESGRLSNEAQHPVTLTTDFWMAESEVTQKQYRNLMGSSPSHFEGDELPVELVSWYDAVAYCNALSVKEKLTPCYQISGTTVGWAEGVACSGYRLPTEAEWEYAARSPATTVYAGSDLVDGVAWYDMNSGFTTHAVKTKTANGRGLYDLSGNVGGWVWDWYQGNYEALPSTDPIGPSTGGSRVIRGGSWSYPASTARVAQRFSDAPTYRGYDVGFRFVRSYP